jgi:hypothetical protein
MVVCGINLCFSGILSGINLCFFWYLILDFKEVWQIGSARRWTLPVPNRTLATPTSQWTEAHLGGCPSSEQFQTASCSAALSSPVSVLVLLPPSSSLKCRSKAPPPCRFVTNSVPASQSSSASVLYS